MDWAKARVKIIRGIGYLGVMFWILMYSTFLSASMGTTVLYGVIIFVGVFLFVWVEEWGMKKVREVQELHALKWAHHMEMLNRERENQEWLDSRAWHNFTFQIHNVLITEAIDNRHVSAPLFGELSRMYRIIQQGGTVWQIKKN